MMTPERDRHLPLPLSVNINPHAHRPTLRALLTTRRLLVPVLLLGTLSLLLISPYRLTPHRSISPSTLPWRRKPPSPSSTIDWPSVGAFIPHDEALETRLRDWESSPTLEPADWVQQSIRTCPAQRIKPNQNTVQVWDSHLLWSSLNSSALYGLRGAMIAHLRKAKRQGRLGKEAWGKGKGLVFTAGNADTFERVLLTLKLLNRHLNTFLPAEIFSFPGEEPSDEVRSELFKLGATFKVVGDAVRDTKRTKNYHIKATAIIQSSFQEVLYLDSDNIPAAGLAPSINGTSLAVNKTDELWGDPSGLWEAKAYKRLGLMQWPDYWRTTADNPIWSVIGVACRDEWEQEAGQILIDKKQHLDGLLLAEWMMDSSRFKFWFNFSDGDKDMFRYAFLALRKRWAVPGRYVAGGMFPRPTMTGPCSHTMLQHDHRGRPLFVHQNLLKQIPSGIGKGFAWGVSREVRSFQNGLKYQDDYPPGSLDEDYDVDCDMLANVGNDGRGMKAAPPAVRRRAVAEKGVRAFFHDMKWEDPRSEEELASSKAAAAAFTGKTVEEVDVSFTVSSDGLEIKFSPDSLQVYEWAEDPRLSDFEDAFFAEGGHLSGVGF